MAAASDAAAGHPAGDALDVRGGGPNGQEDATYWLAAGPVPVAGQRNWWVDLGSVQTVTAVQARLALATPSRVTVEVRFLDNGGGTIAFFTLFDGTAGDSDAIGGGLPTPVPGVREVHINFLPSPSGVAPGLRTVGVYVQ